MQESDNSSDQQFQKTDQDFEKLKNEIDQAKKILSDLEDFSKKFQSLRDLLDNKEDGVETNLDWVKRSAEESEKLKKASEGHLNSISEMITSINEKISFMDKAYEDFLIIQGEIGKTTHTIIDFSSTSEGLKNDIEIIKQDSQNKLSEIGNLLDSVNNKIAEMDSVKNKIAEMDSAYHNFLGIKVKIEDENHGLGAMFRFVEEIKEKSIGLRNEIRSNHETSDDLRIKIQKNLDDSNGIKQQVQEVADLIVDTGFGNSFQKRAKELLDNYKLWRIIFLSSVIILALFLWILFGSFDAIPDAKVILFRITLTSP